MARSAPASNFEHPFAFSKNPNQDLGGRAMYAVGITCCRVIGWSPDMLRRFQTPTLTSPSDNAYNLIKKHL